MKQIYVKIRDGRIGNESIEYLLVKCYRYNSSIGVAITESTRGSRYVLTDYRTGYYAGKTFKKLKDAKDFLDLASVDYNRWLTALNHIRTLDSYKALKTVNE